MNDLKTYHERLSVYMETCLKNCRVPTWDDWMRHLWCGEWGVSSMNVDAEILVDIITGVDA